MNPAVTEEIYEENRALREKLRITEATIAEQTARIRDLETALRVTEAANTDAYNKNAKLHEENMKLTAELAEASTSCVLPKRSR